MTPGGTKFMLASHLLLLSFSWSVQVVLLTPIVGSLAYIPVIPLMLAIPRKRENFRLNSWHDGVVLLFAVVVFSHAFSSIMTDFSSFLEQGKILLSVGSACLVYFYVSRIASRQELRLAMLAIIISASVFSMFWLYDSYLRTVLGEITWYNFRMLEYILERNGFTESNVNTSVVGPQYRSYGLLDKHTTTGAYIAIGSLAYLTIVKRKLWPGNILILIAALTILFIGAGTTALFVSLVLLPIAVILLHYRDLHWPKLLILVSLTLVAWYTLLVILANFPSGIGTLVSDRLGLAGMQFHFMTNFQAVPYAAPGGGTLNVSYPDIAVDYGVGIVQHLKNRPWVAIFGQGLLPNGDENFARGGDLALAEVIVTLGIPLSTIVFIMVADLIFRGLRGFIATEKENEPDTWLLFSSFTGIFLAVSLLHYDVVFKKELLPITFLVLGWLVRSTVSPPGLSGHSAAVEHRRRT